MPQEGLSEQLLHQSRIGSHAALRALHDDTLDGKLVQADAGSRREGFAIARS